MGKLSTMLVAMVCLTMFACGDDAPATDDWRIVHEELPEALLSVWGTSADDVWTVGSDVGNGPLVMHYDGTGWERLETGHSGDLWWVHGFAGGPIFFGGEGGAILRYENGTFETMETPGPGIVFGIWGSSPSDVWAVGGAQGGASGAFAWRFDGIAWTAVDDFPEEVATTAALWKVHGRSDSDVWMVGSGGAALHWDGNALTQDDAPTGGSLFTLHANSEGFVAVGGFGTGAIFENTGVAGWQLVDLQAVDPLIGVHLTEDGGWAVGQNGVVMRREGGVWAPEPTMLPFFDGLHAVWVDPEGGVWAVGGQVLVSPLERGALIHKGPEISGEIR